MSASESQNPAVPRPGMLVLLALVLIAAGFATAPYLAFFYAPQESSMGFIQKIFYFHVPCAWAMLISAITAGVYGGIQLFGKNKGPHPGVIAASELAVVFGILMLITGPLWARVAWGHYWVWDVRLTTALILFLLFVGVLVARKYGGPTGDKVAAALALFGAADVPLIYISVRIWNTIHPKTSVVPTLGSRMRLALWTAVFTFIFLLWVLMMLRIRAERASQQLEQIYARIDELQARREMRAARQS